MAKKFQILKRDELRKVKKGETLTEHGISFLRQEDGDGVFSVNIMVDGQRIHRVVGRESDGTTLTQVEQFIAQARTDAKHDRLALPNGRKTFLSFAEAAEKYLKALEENGGKNIPAKRQQLKSHLIPFFGKMQLAKISTQDIDRYKKSRKEQKAVRGHSPKTGATTLKETGASDATINRELSVLSHLLNRAHEWGWITHIRAKVKRLKEANARIEYLTTEQAARLVEAAKHDSNPQIYPFIVIALETSMRKMEILSIQMKNIDLDRKVIYIPKAKAGRREQPITNHLAKFLKGYMETEKSQWLFPSPAAKSGHTSEIRDPFRRVVAAAGLDPDKVVRHTLRHTAITTHLVQAGVDLPTVKRISGHKTLAMVERYAHANGEHIRAAMDKLEKRYGVV